MDIFLQSLISDASIPQNGYWRERPALVICSNLNGKEEKIHTAKRWWEELGYRFGEIHTGYSGAECSGGYIQASIVITLSSHTYGLAQTFMQINTKNKQIQAARIELSQRSLQKHRCITHELGHGLGWSHSSEEMHLMYPIYELGGWEYFGLSFDQYKH